MKEGSALQILQGWLGILKAAVWQISVIETK
jgi:hypothetical protein